MDDMSVAPTGPGFTVAEVKLPKQTVNEDRMLKTLLALQDGPQAIASHPNNAWAPGVLQHRGELNEILRPKVYEVSSWGHDVEDYGRTPDLGV